MYRCGKCNAPIAVIVNVKVRACAHHDAPIIAEASAKLEGRGGLR